MQESRGNDAPGTVEQVLRVLGGESPRRVADDCGVTVETVLAWKTIFVRAGAHALAEHGVAHDAAAAEAGPPLDTGADDGPQLDWCLDEERIGNMVTTLGAMMLEQKGTGG
jgi:hypothetical protein